MFRLRAPGATRWLLVMFLVPQLVAIAARSPATLAQGGSQITVSGQTVTWAAPWSVDTERSSPGAEIDILVLRDGTATVAVVTGPFTLSDATRGLILGYLGAATEAITVVDQGASGGLSYWLDIVPMLDGTTVGAFTTGVQAGATGTLTMVLSPIDSFGAELASAQSAIAIDGVPVFEGVDGGTMQAALGPGAPAAPASQATPDTGFTTAGTWTDPTYGYTVEWAAGWSGNGASGRFQATPSGGGASMIDIWGEPRSPSTTPDRFVDLARETLASTSANDITVQVKTDTHVVVTGVNSFAVTALEMILPADGTTVIMTMVIAAGGDAATVIPPIQAGIRIDGRPILDGWNPAQATTAQPNPATTGFVPVDSWTHPVYGYTVEWAAGWSAIDEPDEETIVVGRDDGNVFAYIDGMRGPTSPDLAGMVDAVVTTLASQFDATVVDTYVGDSNAIIVARATEALLIFEIVPQQGGPVCLALTVGINPAIDAQEAVASYRASVRVDGVAPLAGWEHIGI